AARMLNRYQLAGAVASWWEDAQYDFKALSAGGFGQVVDGWGTTIQAALEDEPLPDGSVIREKTAEPRPGYDHPLGATLMPDYMARWEEVEAEYAEVSARIKAATAEAEGDEEDEGGGPENISPEELDELRIRRSGLARKRKYLEQNFLNELGTKVGALDELDQLDLVLKVLREQLSDRLDEAMAAHRRELEATFRTWADKYAISLIEIEQDREQSAAVMISYLKELGYA